MHRINPIACVGLAALLLGLAATGAPAADAPTVPVTKKGIVIQVSDDNPRTWNLALNTAEQMTIDLAKENIKAEVEIVAFGPGINMLKFDSVVGNRLTKVARNGVAIIACGNSMLNFKLPEKELYPDADIQVVPAGAVEIMKKQQAGWFHIRP